MCACCTQDRSSMIQTQKNVTYQYLLGLPLANPVQDTGKFEIFLLVGAHVQYRVVQGNVPMAVKSKICYILSGLL